MSENTQRSPLAERLRKGLGEGIEFARGDLHLSTTMVPTSSPFQVKRSSPSGTVAT